MNILQQEPGYVILTDTFGQIYYYDKNQRAVYQIDPDTMTITNAIYGTLKDRIIAFCK